MASLLPLTPLLYSLPRALTISPLLSQSPIPRPPFIATVLLFLPILLPPFLFPLSIGLFLSLLAPLPTIFLSFRHLHFAVSPSPFLRLDVTLLVSLHLFLLPTSHFSFISLFSPFPSFPLMPFLPLLPLFPFLFSLLNRLQLSLSPLTAILPRMQEPIQFPIPVPHNPYTASALTLLSFDWVTPIVALGTTRPLNATDVPKLASRFSTETTAHRRFRPIWEHHVRKPYPNLFRAVFAAFGKRLVLGGLLKAVNDFCIFLSPVLLRKIILFLQSRDPDSSDNRKGLWLAACLYATYSTQSIIFNQYFNILSTVQVQLRGALIDAVFNKATRLSPPARSIYTAGQIHNLMATDSRTVSDVVLYIHMLWSSVAQILIAITLLIHLMGPVPTIAGILFIIASMPLQGLLVARVKKLRERASGKTDERVKNVSEAIKGIKLVKLYAWELSFIARILGTRQEELDLLRKMALTEAWNSTIVSSLPTMLTIVAFVAYAISGRELNAAVVFPAIALFNVIRPPLLFLPNTIINAARAAASLSRLQRFLSAQELTPLNETAHAISQDLLENAKVDLAAENASFTWDPLQIQAAPTLMGVSFKVPAGSLCAIVGPTGGGKSSLLAGLLGELPIISGKAGKREAKSLSYCDQVPFIQNATVRDNILFGKPFNEEHYRETIKVCCLIPDLKLLPAGDLTEIGARGVNLSGGQRARVSLARAVYSKSDICLLDDPLSAVDVHVGKSLFHNCIVSKLKGKTRLLTTNHIHFASSPHVDMVIVVGNGTVLEAGSRLELLENPKSEFSKLVRDAGDMGVAEGHNVSNDRDNEPEYLGNVSSPREDDTATVQKSSAMASENRMTAIKTTSSHLIDADGVARYGAIESGRLTEKERKEEGRVMWRHYVEYLKAMGLVRWVIPVLLFAFSTQLFTLSVNVWLSHWSDQSNYSGNTAKMSLFFNLIVFCILGFMAVTVTSGATFSLTYGRIRASVVLHEKLLLSVFGAPSSFFNATPEGRLVNRFNSDLDKVDSSLAGTLQSLLRITLSLSFTLSLVVYGTPGIILLIIPVGLICIFVQEFYRKSQVDLRRLEALARSPLYSHFGETLDGVVTIRAYNDVDRATHANNSYTDSLNKMTYAASSANRWISIRLEALGTIIIFGATCLAIITPPQKISPSLTGLVLSYVMQILGLMTWSVRMFTEAESQMSAIERIVEFSDSPFPQEETGGLSALLTRLAQKAEKSKRKFGLGASHGLISKGLTKKLSASMGGPMRGRWPKRGKVVFDKVKMRYRTDLPLALRSVSFTVNPGEHIGIVGRTGAGKSSTIQSLFRLYELCGGSIFIDGVNIAELGLFELRSRLGMIAQEAVCFSGTLRSNLDMFGEYTVDEVEWALQACGLQDTMVEKVSIDYPVSEEGNNLSVGQRQLLCLGRMLLRESKVVVLDEATSSVSRETEERIEETLRTNLGESSMIVVAHRLQTVMRCDRVIVMERGEVAEIGKPTDLLKDRNSLLSAMVDETGEKSAGHLRWLASLGRRGRAIGEKIESSKTPQEICEIDHNSSLIEDREETYDKLWNAVNELTKALEEAKQREGEGWKDEVRRMVRNLGLIGIHEGWQDNLNWGPRNGDIDMIETDISGCNGMNNGGGRKGSIHEV